MRLITAEQFAREYFPTPPDPRTVRSWIDRGLVPGRRIGRNYYVDSQAFELSTGNTLADDVLGRRLASRATSAQ